MKFIKTIQLSFFMGLLILVSSCKKDPGSIQINVIAEYDGEPLVLFEDYTYHDGSTIEFSKVDMYLSNISLIKSVNSELRLSDIEFVDISSASQSATDAQAGFPIRFNDIEGQSFKGLKFNVGVPSDMNAKEPADFDVTHPLNRSSHYWVPWTSYIFAKTEGNIDSTGGAAPNLGFLQHSGKDELLRSLQVDFTFEVEDEAVRTVNMVIDYKKLYGSSTDHIDIRSKPLAHNPTDLSYPVFMADNYPNAITIRE